MENIKKGRMLRETLYGCVRIGTAVVGGNHPASDTAASPSSSPSSSSSHEMTIIIKEYERSLVEKRCTRGGHRVAEDAKNELRIHAKLCRDQAMEMVNGSSLAPASPSPLAASSAASHIVRLYDLRADESHYYAILEHCSLGEFFAFVSSPSFTRHEARKYFLQLMRGVAWMHSKGVAHRDLSLENILLDGDGTLKICDFGCAIECQPPVLHNGQKATNKHTVSLEEARKGAVGKLKYMAPEVLGCRAYCARKADVWSCGVILFLMLVKCFPFDLPAMSDSRFIAAASGQIPMMLRKWKKAALDAEEEQVLRRIFCPPDARPEAHEILSMKYCQDIMGASGQKGAVTQPNASVHATPQQNGHAQGADSSSSTLNAACGSNMDIDATSDAVPSASSTVSCSDPSLVARFPSTSSSSITRSASMAPAAELCELERVETGDHQPFKAGPVLDMQEVLSPLKAGAEQTSDPVAEEDVSNHSDGLNDHRCDDDLHADKKCEKMCNKPLPSEPVSPTQHTEERDGKEQDSDLASTFNKAFQQLSLAVQ